MGPFRVLTHAAVSHSWPCKICWLEQSSVPHLNKLIFELPEIANPMKKNNHGVGIMT